MTSHLDGGYMRTPTHQARTVASHAVVLAVLLFAKSGFAAPSGAHVVAGHVKLSQGGNTTNLNQQGQTAIVNWQDFSIGQGETVNFNQPNASAAILNRVVSSNPSALMGRLNATGKVYLLNPNGIVVGAGAQIDTAGFIASTAHLANKDFLNGGAQHFTDGSAAPIVNLGSIATRAGEAVLVGYRVVNKGTISAPDGDVKLVAATEFVYAPDVSSDILVSTGVTHDTGGEGVTNTGLIDAANVEMSASNGDVYDLAVNQAGIVRADGISTADGRVRLVADAGTVRVSGKTSASTVGGNGGEVVIGGDKAASNVADRVEATRSANIDVSARSSMANGGSVSVWSGKRTDFAGSIVGYGGVIEGDGGNAEVSSEHRVNYTGLADLTATVGKTGTLLLDPDAAVISTAADATSPDVSVGPSIFNVNTVESNLATADFVIDTSHSGGISVNTAVQWAAATKLSLLSGDYIALNADVSAAGSGTLELLAGASGANYPIAPYDQWTTGGITVASNATVSVPTVVMGYNSNARIGNGAPGFPNYSMGKLDVQGLLETDTLDLQTGTGIVMDSISIANAANRIGTIKSTAGNITTTIGGIDIVDGSGDLTLESNMDTVPWDISIQTVGNLTLASGAKVATSGGSSGDGDIVLASISGSFTNNAGAGAVSANNGTGDVRSLIYTDNPVNSTLGGLGYKPVYDKTVANDAPASITASGDRILYSLAPTLTVSGADTSTTYGTPATFSTNVTGLVGGDTISEALSGSASFSSSGTDAGSYPINVAMGTLAATDYNYKIALANTGTLTINPAPLTITANNDSRLQGAADPAFTATFNGLVNGDTSSVISNLAFTTSATTSSAPGTYTINVTGSNLNYSVTTFPGILTVTAAPTLVITADDKSRNYGAGNPQFTSMITGFQSGDDASIVKNLAYAIAADITSPVGTYTITPQGASASGYLINYIAGMLTINPAPLTITALDTSRYYGDANPSLDVNYSGFVNGETSRVVSGLNVTTAATATSNVGTYAISARGASAPNYAITYQQGTLTVNKAPLTVTIADASKYWGQNNPTFTYSVSGLKLGQTFADVGSLAFDPCVSCAAGDVGHWVIGNTFTQANSNYDVTINDGYLDVQPVPVTVTASDESKVYGDSNPTFHYSVGTSVTDLGIQLLNYVSGVQFSSAATAMSDVGSYAIDVVAAADPNIAYSYAPGTLTVTQRPVDVSTPKASKTYGDPNPDFKLNVTGLVSGVDVASVIQNLGVTTQATTGSGVGYYQLQTTGNVVDSNYAVTFGGAMLTINKANVTIVPDLVSRYYGDDNPGITDYAFTAYGLKNGDTADVIRAGWSTNATILSSPGSYTITPQLAISGNYNVTANTGVLNVLKRPLTVTADDKSKTYGDANPTLTASFSGLAPLDNQSAITGLSLTTPATKSTGAGAVGILVSANANPNYDITFENGTLMINPVSLNIPVGDYVNIYGRASNVMVPTAVTGLVNGDRFQSLGLTLDAPAPTADVGTYPLTVKLTNPNYMVSSDPGQVTINPAPLDVTISNLSRLYGDPNPAMNADLTNVIGLVFGNTTADVLQLATDAKQTSDAGDYVIYPELLDTNYTIANLTSGNLHVARRKIGVKPENIARYYGDGSPEYNVQIIGDGLAPLDTSDAIFDPKLVTVVGSSDPTLLPTEINADVTSVEYYPLFMGNPNYVIKAVPGVYAIMPRPVTITVPDITLTQNQAVPPIIATATNLASFDTVPLAFPDLEYLQVPYSESAPTPVTAATPDDYLAALPEQLTDDYFNATYAADAAPEPGTPPPTSDPLPVPLFSDTPLVTATIVIHTGSLGTHIFGPVKASSDNVYREHLRPYGFNNNNYQVTSVEYGTLIWKPDAVIQAQLAETHRSIAEAKKAKADKQSFLDPAFVPGFGQVAFGLPKAALPAVFTAVEDQLALLVKAGAGGDLLKLVQQAGGGKSKGNKFTKADIYAFLADFNSNPDKQAMVAPIMVSYLLNISGQLNEGGIGAHPELLTAADKALLGAFDSKLTEAKQNLASQIQAKENAYYAEQRSRPQNMGMLAGAQEPDYKTVIQDATQSMMENSVAGIAAGTAGSVGSIGAGFATAEAIEAAGQTIFPHSKAFKVQRAPVDLKARFGGESTGSEVASGSSEASASATSETASEATAAATESAAEAGTAVASESGAEAGTMLATETGVEVASGASEAAAGIGGEVAATTGTEVAATTGAEIAAEGAAEGAGMSLSSLASAGPQVIVTAAIAIGVAQFTKVIDKAKFEGIAANLKSGDPADLRNLDLHSGSEQSNVDKVLFMSAISSMFSGSSSPDIVANNAGGG